MSQPDESGWGRPTSDEPLIRECRRYCFQMRSKCKDAIGQFGMAPYDIRLGFQLAIFDYWKALRPHREESTVDEWWGSAILSEQWTRDGEPVEGIDSLSEVFNMTETISTEKNTVRGLIKEERTVPKVLEFDVLDDFFDTLDDAAKRLGVFMEVRQKRARFTTRKKDPNEYNEPINERVEKPR